MTDKPRPVKHPDPGLIESLREDVDYWKRRADAYDRKRWAVLPSEEDDEPGETWEERYHDLIRDVVLDRLGWGAIEGATADDRLTAVRRINRLLSGY